MMKTVGPLYSGKLNVRWDEKGMGTQYERTNEALQMRNRQQQIGSFLKLLNHSLTLDAVICCQYKEDAARIRKALSKRLEKFKLKLNEEKTSCTSFSRNDYCKGLKQGVFHFLGFTFYWGRSRKGDPLPKVRTHAKRMKSKLKNVNEWAKMVRNKHRLSYIWKLFCSKLEGHIRYYGVSFNIGDVATFVCRAVRVLYKWLNRRSQRKSFDWAKFELFMGTHPLPTIKVHHSFF